MRMLLVFVFLAFSAPVSAQLEPPDIPPGEDHIEALSAGSLAPFDGQLLETDTAIRWANRLRWYRHELQLQTELHAEALVAVQDSREAAIRIVEASYSREIEGLRQDLRDQAETFVKAKRPFVRTGAFGFIVGVVSAGVLVVVGALAF